MERNNYEQMTVSVLKNVARERGKTRYSRLNKSEIIKQEGHDGPGSLT